MDFVIIYGVFMMLITKITYKTQRFEPIEHNCIGIKRTKSKLTNKESNIIFL